MPPPKLQTLELKHEKLNFLAFYLLFRVYFFTKLFIMSSWFRRACTDSETSRHASVTKHIRFWGGSLELCKPSIAKGPSYGAGGWIYVVQIKLPLFDQV